MKHNTNKSFSLNLLLSLIFIWLSGCEKPEGPGGNAEIKGRVITEVYDPEFRVLQSSIPAPDEDVFIIYGNKSTHSDDVVTSFNGEFSFPYLTKGDYTIFVYSDDKQMTSEDGKATVEVDVSIKNNDQVYNIGDIIIYESVDIDDGFASISGKVEQVNYSNDFIFVKDTTRAQELDVYLIYEDDETYCERTRTLADGTYSFQHLIKGNYTVLHYSENTSGSLEGIAVTRTARITETYQHIDLGTTYSNKED